MIINNDLTINRQTIQQSKMVEKTDKQPEAKKLNNEQAAEVKLSDNKVKSSKDIEDIINENIMSASSSINDISKADDMIRKLNLNILKNSDDAVMTQSKQSTNVALELLK